MPVNATPKPIVLEDNEEIYGSPSNKSNLDNWTSSINVDFDDAAKGGDREWDQGFCSPEPSTCCLSCCCPSVSFGRIRYRMEHPEDPNLEAFDAWGNGNCFAQYVSGCFHMWCILPAINRTDLRERLSIKGNVPTDILSSWCCLCLSLSQEEAQLRREDDRKMLLKAKSGYSPNLPMVYPSTAPPQLPPRALTVPVQTSQSAKMPSLPAKEKEARLDIAIADTSKADNAVAALKLLKKAATKGRSSTNTDTIVKVTETKSDGTQTKITQTPKDSKDKQDVKQEVVEVIDDTNDPKKVKQARRGTALKDTMKDVKEAVKDVKDVAKQKPGQKETVEVVVTEK